MLHFTNKKKTIKKRISSSDHCISFLYAFDRKVFDTYLLCRKVKYLMATGKHTQYYNGWLLCNLFVTCIEYAQNEPNNFVMSATSIYFKITFRMNKKKMNKIPRKQNNLQIYLKWMKRININKSLKYSTSLFKYNVLIYF